MADDLKRVGLVFKADGSTEFNRSLKEINSSVQENRSAFKLAQSQWDDSTKSVDKLKDRQKYLSDQTKEYSDKVKILKGELAELENAENRDEQAIQKKRMQLNTAKTSLNNYKSGLKEVNEELEHGKAQIKEYGDKLTETGDKLSNVGKKMSAGVTAPLVAIGAAGIKATMELDDGYDTIITKTGATGKELEKLNNVADEVFSSMPVDMSDVGIAVGELNTRFGVTGDALQGMSEEFLKFANINDTDLNSSIGTTNKIMQQFGVDSKDTGNVLGILTKRAQETGVGMDSLMNLLSTNSATFNELGFSVTDSTNLLAQFEENGVDATAAMTALRKSVVTMAKDGVPADEALGQIINSIKNAQTNTEALNIASETFGTKGAVQMTDAIRSGRFSVDDLNDSLGNYTNVVNDTWESTQDPWDQLKTSMNNVALALAAIGNAVFEVLGPYINEATAKIKEFSEWFRGLNNEQRETISTIGMVVASIGPLIAILGKVFSTLGKLSGGISLILSHPILAIIAGVIIALVTLYTKCEWFRDGVNSAFQTIYDVVTGAWKGIKKAWGGAVDFFTGIQKGIQKAIGAITGTSKKSKIDVKNSVETKSLLKTGVEWFASGGILNRPTVFGQRKNGNLLAGGEDGAEAVLPISLLKQYIAEENAASNAQLVAAFKEVFEGMVIQNDNRTYIGDREFYNTVSDTVTKRIDRKQSDKGVLRGKLA